jgi:putative transposase
MMESVTGTVVRYRYRAYPTAKQTRAISQLLGGCRVAFNDALTYARQQHAAGNPYPKAKGLQHHVLTLGKRTPERAWMRELCAVALQQAVTEADVAYRNFFASIKGERKGRRMGYPKYRRRSESRQSARFTKAARFTVTVTGEREATVRLTGIGELKFVASRPLPSEPSSVTVIREADGRTYVSFVVTVDYTPSDTVNRTSGIDMGLSSFATVLTVDDNGEEKIGKIDTPKFLRRRSRALARSQRAHARKQKGSRNREKSRRKLAVHHRKVRDARLDHAHQQAATLVAANDVLAVETLSMTGMAKTSGASVHDQAIGQFLRILEEKATRTGTVLVKVGRTFPSTQLCSNCHHKTGPKGREELHVRRWTCAECGVTHDRDVNAARNILAEGLRLLALQQTSDADGLSESINACGEVTTAPVTEVSDLDEAGNLETEQPGHGEAGSSTGDQAA